MADGITRPGTVENFVKALHPVRISPEAVAVYLTELDRLTRDVTAKAVTLMQAGGRKTLSREDVEAAFRASASTGDDAPVMEPSGIFRQLDRMPPPQVFEVVRLIQGWLASRPR